MTPDSRSLVLEREVAIKSTLLQVEPVYLEFSLRTARRNNSASEALLAAAFPHDVPLVGGRWCAGGREGEECAPPRGLSFASSSADSCEMDDVARVSTVGVEISQPLEKKKNCSNGLKDSKGRRPGKKARALYQALVDRLQDMVRQDPSLSLESLPIPQCVLDHEMLMVRLVARVESARPAVC
jgi:hypothetical protein